MARQIVLRKLTGQARTRAELDKALAAKRVPDEVSRAVLDRFTELGLINDEEFAHSWVESRQQRRTLSKRGLRQELSRKGVDAETVALALHEVEEEDELSAARALAARKLRGLARYEPHVQYRRLAGALARRGFPSPIVVQVLNEVKPQMQGPNAVEDQPGLDEA